MQPRKYRTAPVPSKEMPGGVPFIVGNEAAERFSYYGLHAFLVIFMTKFLMDASGNPDYMTGEEATAWFHTFGTAVYFLPIVGAIVADVFLGKYRTIIWLSLVYCAGHAVLFMDQTRGGLSIGLALIAIGSGGIKPCVSAHVGDQFGATNEHLLNTVLNYFYMAINVGAGVSIFVTPWLLENYGPHVAFGTPGALMFISTIVFWMGRHKFVHIPPGGSAFLKEAFSGVGLKAIFKLAPIFAFVAVFWSLFDQTGSTWVLQSEKLNRNFLGFEWLSSQIQAINPVMIIVFVPLMAGFSFRGFKWEGFYKKIDRVWKLTPLRKIGIGFFIAVPSFLIPALIESQIAVGEFPSIAMQVASYAIITIAEVFISITCLEFAYKQAPKKMKSVILALFLMSVALGNLFTAGLNFFIQNPPPSFTPDKVGDYELELSAYDETQVARATVRITAAVKEPEQVQGKVESGEKKVYEKKPPEANAGRSMAVKPGEQIRMYATAEKGDSRGSYVYVWRVKKVPEGSKVSTGSLSEATTRNPTFVPDVEGEYVLEFTVYVVDGAGADSASSDVTVICNSGNLPPFANAGASKDGKPQKGTVGESVVLNGGATYDPNFGDELKYRWRFVSMPAGSKLTNSDIVASTLATATSKLKGAAYYNFFAIMMLIAAFLFVPLAMWYKGETHLQDEEA